MGWSFCWDKCRSHFEYVGIRERVFGYVPAILPPSTSVSTKKMLPCYIAKWTLEPRRRTFDGISEIERRRRLVVWGLKAMSVSWPNTSAGCNRRHKKIQSHLRCPTLWHLSSACLSLYGLKSISCMITTLAAVKLMPTPPRKKNFPYMFWLTNKALVALSFLPRWVLRAR